jgi:hypothetical protein
MYFKGIKKEKNNESVKLGAKIMNKYCNNNVILLNTISKQK